MPLLYKCFWKTIYRLTETFDLQINVLYQQSSITIYIKVLFTQQVSNKPEKLPLECATHRHTQ